MMQWNDNIWVYADSVMYECGEDLVYENQTPPMTYEVELEELDEGVSSEDIIDDLLAEGSRPSTAASQKGLPRPSTFPARPTSGDR